MNSSLAAAVRRLQACNWQGERVKDTGHRTLHAAHCTQDTQDSVLFLSDEDRGQNGVM